MSHTIFLSNISSFVGQEVALRGWVSNFRSSGKIFFLQFRDGTGTIQAVVSKDAVSEQAWASLQDMGLESSVELAGMVKRDDRAESGFELEARQVRIVQNAKDYPISKKEHGPDFLLDHRHLWIRSKRQWAILRIRHTIIYALYDFLREQQFMRFDTPVLTPNACEGTTELFEVDYFGNPSYLSQSGQLYLESAIMSFGRAYDFGPVFRAEKSKTRRHLIEFWMLDAEMAYADCEENMNIQERLVTYVVSEVLKKNRLELAILERDTAMLEKVTPPFYKKTYTEVVKELQSMGSEIHLGDDLGAADETMLTVKYDKPVFVKEYPRAIKAFYMKKADAKPDDQGMEFVKNNDLLAPEGYGEIIGGSEREDRYEVLLESIQREKLPIADFQWYLDLRKYGSVPHSGFGVGLERLVTWICGLKHVRESIPFPRLINRYKP
ncbi:MAG: asparagine--tRNA ligase [Parcubacteria group bacterium]|nr:asparagine--tRNA ligase [Parcubacteria group bacterium]